MNSKHSESEVNMEPAYIQMMSFFYGHFTVQSEFASEW